MTGTITFTFIQEKTALEINEEIILDGVEKFTVDYKDGKIIISDLIVSKPRNQHLGHDLECP